LEDGFWPICDLQLAPNVRFAPEVDTADSPVLQLICPTGKSVKRLSSPVAKKIPLGPSGKSSLEISAIPPR
jgi:hypothetical protein